MGVHLQWRYRSWAKKGKYHSNPRFSSLDHTCLDHAALVSPAFSFFPGLASWRAWQWASREMASHNTKRPAEHPKHTITGSGLTQQSTQ